MRSDTPREGDVTAGFSPSPAQRLRLAAAVDLQGAQAQGLQLDEAACVGLVVQALVVLEAGDDLQGKEGAAGQQGASGMHWWPQAGGRIGGVRS